MKQVRGGPTDGWQPFFDSLGIRWLQYDLDDPTTKGPGTEEFCQKSADAWLKCWSCMCAELNGLFDQKAESDACGILFHCFGGINRSSAALCAWLMFRYECPASECISSLLNARPTLGPWKRRPHALWALKSWEIQLGIMRGATKAMHK
eukprot:Skav200594  [mRNA]  locus=scaffold4926:378:824:- [translate_table: standard]